MALSVSLAALITTIATITTAATIAHLGQEFQDFQEVGRLSISIALCPNRRSRSRFWVFPLILPHFCY